LEEDVYKFLEEDDDEFFLYDDDSSFYTIFKDFYEPFSSHKLMSSQLYNFTRLKSKIPETGEEPFEVGDFFDLFLQLGLPFFSFDKKFKALQSFKDDYAIEKFEDLDDEELKYIYDDDFQIDLDKVYGDFLNFKKFFKNFKFFPESYFDKPLFFNEKEVKSLLKDLLDLLEKKKQIKESFKDKKNTESARKELDKLRRQA